MNKTLSLAIACVVCFLSSCSSMGLSDPVKRGVSKCVSTERGMAAKVRWVEKLFGPGDEDSEESESFEFVFETMKMRGADRTRECGFAFAEIADRQKLSPPDVEKLLLEQVALNGLQNWMLAAGEQYPPFDIEKLENQEKQSGKRRSPFVEEDDISHYRAEYKKLSRQRRHGQAKE